MASFQAKRRLPKRATGLNLDVGRGRRLNADGKLDLAVCALCRPSQTVSVFP